jgi:uncharacterized ubiquitin-like protein YukD
MPEQPEATAGEVNVILRQMMGAGEYDLAAPADATVNAILVGVLESPDCPFRQVDDAGRRIQYTLVWEEGGNRALRGSETLGGAGVADGDHLVLRHEARAGMGGR